jgi:hypothetical protein
VLEDVAHRLTPVMIESLGFAELTPQLDPVKKRIRAGLMDLDDQQLSAFGFTPVDIAILRGCRKEPT